MPLLVVGSIAIDSVETPVGNRPDCMGGACSYFGYSSSFFADAVRLVGVVGADFPGEFLDVFARRDNIDTAGIQRSDGKSFRWSGKYTGDMAVADTLSTELNVLGEFEPHLPEEYKDTPYVFLANDSPDNHHKVLDQLSGPKLVFADTMNLWIEIAHERLLELMKRIDGLVLNDAEALMLTQESSIVPAGKKLLTMGPKHVIVKKGEHGATLFSGDAVVSMPAYPTDKLVDPTGAGDSFAGGFMGHLCESDDTSLAAMKRAMAYGTVTASVNVEGFSLDCFQGTTRQQLQDRYEQYRKMLTFG